MLVLSRKVDEDVRIAEDIIVRVIEIQKDKVRLAFIAPRDIEIHREEIYQAIVQGKESKANASQS